MIKFREIIPISLFKKNTAEYLSKLELLEGPILLTVHGRGAIVMHEINSYMNIAELADMACHKQSVEAMIDKLERGEIERG